MALTDRASMDKDERERGSVCPIALVFRCRGLAKDPVARRRRGNPPLGDAPGVYVLEA